MLEMFKEIFGGNNYAGLRAELAAADPPLIPFFGMYLTDITFTEEGSPDFITVKDVQLINFGKRYECDWV
jgi:son of sevenless-like protein